MCGCGPGVRFSAGRLATTDRILAAVIRCYLCNDDRMGSPNLVDIFEMGKVLSLIGLLNFHPALYSCRLGLRLTTLCRFPRSTISRRNKDILDGKELAMLAW